MKNIIKQMTLKRKIFSLIAIAVFFIISFQTVSYLSIQNVIENRAKDYSQSTIFQTKTAVEQTLDRVENRTQKFAYNTYLIDFLKADTIEEKIEVHPYVENVINNLLENNTEFRAAALVKENNWRNFYGDLDYFVYQKVVNDLGEEFNNLTRGQFEIIEHKGEIIHFYLYPIFDLHSSSNKNNKLGTAIIRIDSSNINKSIRDISANQYTTFFIADENDRFITSSLKSNLIDNSKAFENYNQNSEYIVQNERINFANWRIYGFTSRNKVAEDLKQFPLMIIFSSLTFVILLLGIGFVLNKNITKPVISIAKSMDLIGENNDNQRINLDINGELGIIVEDANKMLDKIENFKKHEIEMQTQIYETKISRHKAELSALQSQINPHFLYNTLECIRSIGAVYESQEIMDISIAMADIFRYSIKSNRFVKVKEEIEIIESYLKIMKLRFPKRINYEIDIKNQIKNKKIIKMLLQPIVENAFYHGLESKTDGGKILIKAEIKDEDIIFLISDNGKGIKEEKLNLLNNSLNRVLKIEIEDFKKHGIGILNINKRIKLNYGEEYGLKLDSKIDQGTEVEIIIPVEK
ncbi:sensor histidine kinase [Halanaerobium congolense]|uniref:Two-component system, sensor histidine kinase YesM n=2 Tax=Halanaerobium TaxID=2330 RepID=A0A1G6KKK3_9FIRM|nr:sensor histidine kinase [Halanaerobium congolense]SDC31560.1 two-component system, sensor histidine kinase YesM [Halanaerobium congolense]